jgi:hypothetical protein
MGNIIFMDDQDNVRRIFGQRLKRLFTEIADVIVLEPLPTTEDMMAKLLSLENVVSYIIDENLTYSGGTNYQGVDLIRKIRELDTKVPIYILTSDTSWVDPLLGDIEFVVDKVSLNQKENKEKFLQKFTRHLFTYKDIKTDHAKRFDELLIKSLSEPLQPEEQKEYEALNIIRAKVFIDEASISQEDLDFLTLQTNKLDELEKKLQEIKDGK